MLWYTTPLWSMETIVEGGGERPGGPGDLSPRLLVINGREPGKMIGIPQGRHRLGRENDCEIQLLDPSVSRHHAVILRTPDGAVTIENLSATNGTQVNEDKIDSVQLHNGDIVQIGGVVLKYLEPGTMEAELFQHVYRLAIQDALTETLTKSAIVHHLEALMCGETEPFAVILMDLDLFKLVNDTYGHIAGDFVLKTVAGIARNTANRPGELVGRFGGEEFLILLPKTDRESASAIAESMRAKIEAEPVMVEGLPQPIHVTASFGIAVCQGPAAEGDQETLIILDKADKALYRAKHEGRNTVRIADQPADS
ncbi:diguanylate cyclase [bacterium]|nr:diguanylate cyclase [bacterium]